MFLNFCKAMDSVWQKKTFPEVGKKLYPRKDHGDPSQTCSMAELYELNFTSSSAIPLTWLWVCHKARFCHRYLSPCTYVNCLIAAPLQLTHMPTMLFYLLQGKIFLSAWKSCKKTAMNWNHGQANGDAISRTTKYTSYCSARRSLLQMLKNWICVRTQKAEPPIKNFLEFGLMIDSTSESNWRMLHNLHSKCGTKLEGGQNLDFTHKPWGNIFNTVTTPKWCYSARFRAEHGCFNYHNLWRKILKTATIFMFNTTSKNWKPLWRFLLWNYR